MEDGAGEARADHSDRERGHSGRGQDDSQARARGARAVPTTEKSTSGNLPESLEEALLDATSELPSVSVQSTGGRHEFFVGSRLVATLDGSVAEFRLDPAVAAAALRTPDTSRSTSSAERIAFAPAELDLYALDRAVAWLRSAVRLAG
jgi:hypothetical protein